MCWQLNISSSLDNSLQPSGVIPQKDFHEGKDSDCAEFDIT